MFEIILQPATFLSEIDLAHRFLYDFLMKPVFELILLFLSSLAFISVIWIVIPAPAPVIWLFAVAVSEWSLWISLFSILVFLISILNIVLGSGGSISVASIFLSTVTFAVSVYPFVSTYNIAKANGVSLSFGRYFEGLTKSTNKIDSQTDTFSSYSGSDLKLDVYLPSRSNSNNGASVIVVHGGSWSKGERSDFPQWNAWLAENGFTVFDIDYRLSPQPNYLSATADVKCAMAWIADNESKFSIDAGRIAILGRSAGAHLALLAAYSGSEEKIPPSCTSKIEPPNVRAVVSFYAPVELLWAYDNPANPWVIDGPGTLSNFLGGSPNTKEMSDRYLLASPTTHVDKKTPPTLIIHGGHDQLVRTENLVFLDEKLTANNVPHQTLIFPYAQHGFDYNINGWASQVTEKVMLKFLEENTGTRSAVN